MNKLSLMRKKDIFNVTKLFHLCVVQTIVIKFIADLTLLILRLNKKL